LSAGNPFDKMARTYRKDLAAQTRGSYRIKSANKDGPRLVKHLNTMRGAEAEQAMAVYIARAQLRVKLATKHPRKDLALEERVFLAFLLFEREAFDLVSRLDRLDAIAAISRVRRCARCGSWFWGRVKKQRYCSERCRVRHYQGSPEGRKYKRECARKYYWRDKKLNEEALQSAMNSVGGRKGRTV
jgi:hypothetical protein